MAIDLRQLGDKLYRMRCEVLRLEVTDVAERTGIPEDRLRAIETGLAKATGDEVLILADAYGEPVSFFLTNERSASIDRVTELYRMYGDTFSAEDRQSVQCFLALCRSEHEIEALLGSRPRVIKFSPPAPIKHMKTHGQRSAEKLRIDLRLGDTPIDNPFHLARQLGCHVFRRRLQNSKVSGVMLRHEEYGPCILVNYGEDLYRQNFSAAHELCHALLDNDHGITVSFEKDTDEGREDLRMREWRANSFASHLLFPDNARRGVPLSGDIELDAPVVLKYARHFRVNVIVILLGLLEAGRISEQQVKDTQSRVRLARSGKDDADLSGEPELLRIRRKKHLEAGLSSEYVETVMRAYREGEISLGRLADALIVSPVDVATVLADLGRSLEFQENIL